MPLDQIANIAEIIDEECYSTCDLPAYEVRCRLCGKSLQIHRRRKNSLDTRVD